ncbi:MAG: nitroreductase family protein [Elusimicrobia bacterium]|nr:nitroreductase family protein [Elusimicrobiota bacterium]
MMRTAAVGNRKPDHAVDSIFLDRWSPRAMSGEEVPLAELMSVFEAARWAPSSYNNQPWRFLYSRRSGARWNDFVDLLVPGNRAWAEYAGALVVIVSRKTFELNGKPSRTHSFDAGAAWGCLALQGSMLGLVVHGMEGFDYEKARRALNVPDDFQVEAMAAIGRPGSKEDLPAKLKAMEAPSGRKRTAEIALEGGFRGR